MVQRGRHHGSYVLYIYFISTIPISTHVTLPFYSQYDIVFTQSFKTKSEVSIFTTMSAYTYTATIWGLTFFWLCGCSHGGLIFPATYSLHGSRRRLALKRSNDYPVYKRASELAVLVKLKPQGGKGKHKRRYWSGSSSGIDFFYPGSWDFWISLFKTKTIDDQRSWTESTDTIGIWNEVRSLRCSLMK